MSDYKKILIENGVNIPYPDNVIIEDGVTVAPGTIILPFTIIKGKTAIGKNNTVGPACNIADSTIGDGNLIEQAMLKQVTVGDGNTVGPFAFLRDGAVLKNNCRVGDFVEIKKSVLHDGVKAAHLSYIGDAEVGCNTNVGCGAVFCNFNGKIKQRTVVGKNVFIGANTNLVAPLSIGSDSFIAAGSTITEDLPDGSFAIAREKQSVKQRKGKAE